ncbi:MAG: hypothetical protein L0H20_09050, partial [Corynebacterium sp.]|uniref:hypothetical protein n=1 Tax=Corynebacterium sp. TaxID=1720 RepID=UPI002648908D
SLLTNQPGCLTSVWRIGGAGIAQAQGSLGSLTGSLGSADVELTVASDKDGVDGESTNNTEADLSCGIAVMDADVMKKIEASVAEGETVTEASAKYDDEVQDSQAEGKNALALANVAAGGTEEWTGGGYGPEENPNSGAVATCGEGDTAVTVFAYEDAGMFGSLDMGSLGS